jgi:hypothetical protein
MSEIKVNSIKGVGASSAAITVNNTDGTCTANLTNRTNKNLLINGSFLIAQRGVSSTSSGKHTVDRFGVDFANTDEAPTQAQADVASGTTPYTLGFRKCLKVTNGNQTSGAGSADFLGIEYYVEAQDMANSGWNYTSSSSNVTLSFYIKSSVAQSFKGFVRTRDGTEQRYAFDTGSLSADTWTKITKTIPGNSNLQFDNNNDKGLQIVLAAFWGTDYTDNSVTENAWSAYGSGTRMKDNTSTWYTTNDATLEVTGFQLEVSDHATDFEHRSFAQELQLCKRYYEQFDPQLVPLMRFNHSSGSAYTSHHFEVTKRTAPTGSYNGTYINASGYAGNPSFANASVTDISIYSANSCGTNNILYLNSDTGGGFLTFNAEL